MNLMCHHQIENIIAQFELGKINKQQAVRSLTDMPEYPDFKGIWEMLIKRNLASEDMEWFLEQHPARRTGDG